jgi:hypothetical protein
MRAKFLVNDPTDGAAGLRKIAADLSSTKCVMGFGSKTHQGYWISRYRGKRIFAHRLVCQFAHGEPPTEKHQAAHSCGNAWCVNPNCLRWATPKENTDDKAKHGTLRVGEQIAVSVLTEEAVIDIRHHFRHGTSSRFELAAKYGVGPNTINKAAVGDTWAHVPGIVNRKTLREYCRRGSKHFKAKLTEAKVAEIRKRYHEDGVASLILAEEYGVTRNTINRVANGSTWSHVPGASKPNSSKRGENHHFARLTDAQVLEIRELAKVTGMLHREIGEKYGVGQPIISNIVARRTWKYL